MKKTALEKIRDSVDVKKLMEHYGAHPTGHGNYRSTCQLHGGNNPTAFVFSQHNKMWYCHTGCMEGGDVFDYVMKMEDITFIESARFLADMFDITVDWATEEVDENAFRDEARAFIESMRKRSKVAPELPQYKFQGQLEKVESYRSYSPEAIKHWKLYVCTGGELKDRVVMPIEDSRGRIVGVTGRKIKADLPSKWMHRPRNLHTGWVLTGLGRNLKAVQEADEVIVTEGIFDCVRVWDAGFKNVCTPIGTFFTDEHEMELYKTGVTQYVSGFDNDVGGRNGTRKVIERLKYKFDLTILNLPEGRDPDDLTIEEVREAYETRLTWREWVKKYGMEKEQHKQQGGWSDV